MITITCLGAGAGSTKAKPTMSYLKKKYRVVENDWWRDITTDMVLEVIGESDWYVILDVPGIREQRVPLTMLKVDFEEVVEQSA